MCFDLHSCFGGCCGSCCGEPEEHAPRPRRRHHRPAQEEGGAMAIGEPEDVTIHIPRNRADEHGVPVQPVTRDIDRKTLVAALNHVSQYVAHRNHHVDVIAVGGAVNTLYLRSRGTTHDVDVFGSDFGNTDRHLLDEAMVDAQRKYPGLGTDWLNTETQIWMTGPLHRELTTGAREQGVKVFDEAGLTIYAAPWEYAFSAKISRIMTGGDQARPYDLADAVTYIHQYIRAHGDQPVPVATAMAWAKRYHHNMTEDILRTRVNREYRKRYNEDAFV